MSTKQFSTFLVNESLYGIEVDKVQEISNVMSITSVPLAPSFIHGLINLRGQIATAIDLRELFLLPKDTTRSEYINVVCKVKGVLLSFMVDEISDVMELDQNEFEETPENIDINVTQFMVGVYKLKTNLLSILDVEKIMDYINKKGV